MGLYDTYLSFMDRYRGDPSDSAYADESPATDMTHLPPWDDRLFGIQGQVEHTNPALEADKGLYAQQQPASSVAPGGPTPSPASPFRPQGPLGGAVGPRPGPSQPETVMPPEGLYPGAGVKLPALNNNKPGRTWDGWLDRFKDPEQVGRMMQGVGASLMSMYDPKGAAVMADLLKERISANKDAGKFTTHMDPTNGLMITTNTQTGERTITRLGTPKTENVYQQEYDKDNAKEHIKINQDIIKGAETGRALLSNSQQLQDVLKTPNLYTGPGASMVLAGKKLLAEYGLADKQGVAAGELAEAVSNRMALQIRNVADGGGMPGSMSDSDREFLRASVASISNSPEGHRQLTEYGKVLGQRAIDIDSQRREYLRTHGGRLDHGWADHLAQWNAMNPMIDTFRQIAGPSAASGASSLGSSSGFKILKVH